MYRAYLNVKCKGRMNLNSFVSDFSLLFELCLQMSLRFLSFALLCFVGTIIRCRLKLANSIWLSACFFVFFFLDKVLLKHIHTHSFLSPVAAFMLQWQSGEVATDAIQSTKLKIFTNIYHHRKDLTICHREVLNVRSSQNFILDPF